ncbi:uncharacterized protein MELLADRAFT_89305 [Melampsora larici-populina 98AG31]|uniref:Uncharacterized protein n=1 Tax=Melampsora larici-populina (strain 98AG31 / pathotype 3-4-7) TaxID=747676 RepID=F4R5N7_MELLP|nr:uncharacterized protein MELLADRAFT_89305 [Melampsora larici-populina 98AG31]EGG12231.1 hypothetical protein MELLADRAFT_89305 [Melampsora larici-populina 98AG31]
MVIGSPKRNPNSPGSPFHRQKPDGSRPRLSSVQNTPSPHRPRRSETAFVDIENQQFYPSSLPHSPASPGVQSTPPDRRSFQGDHHRHRYMIHSGQQSRPRPSPKSQSGQSPGQRSDTAARVKPPSGPPRKPTPQRHLTSDRSPHHRPTPQHLGAPANAHYSPHYGSAAHQASPSKRKPPPPAPAVDLQQSTNRQTRALTPESPSPAPNSNKNSPFNNSPGASVRSFIQHESRTPSPSASPRSGLVRKIGSVLSAPFRSSQSRRGSDASEINCQDRAVKKGSSGPSADLAKPTSQDFQDRAASQHLDNIVLFFIREIAAILDNNGSHNRTNIQEHLPRMPTPGESPGLHRTQQAGDRCLTPSQLITRGIDLEESVVVPNEHERVLRVVNGCATTSTQATTNAQRPDVRDVIKDDRPVSNLQPTPSFSTSTSVAAAPFRCNQCDELEHKLQVEQNRIRALEQLVEDQMTRLDQFKNWSTAKINTLEHALKAHDGLLQDLERQQYDSKASPDLKSTYLIALQKDFVDLHSRVVSLETFGNTNKSTETSTRVPSSVSIRGLTDATSTRGWNSSVSPSTLGTSLGRQTLELPPQPISPVPLRSHPTSPLLRSFDEPEELEDHQPPTLPHASCPATVSTSPIPPDLERLQDMNPASEVTTPKRSTWQASSPAKLASKLAPLSPPTPKGLRNTPGTPSSRSPRPRYTAALSTKIAATPLSLGSNIGSPGIKRASAGPSTSYGNSEISKLERGITTGRTTPMSSQPAFTAPNTPSHYRAPSTPLNHARAWQPLDLTKNAITGGHTKRFSVISNPSSTSSPFVAGSNKKPVGDLIRMFDKQT